jgi:two-component system sensor histidine kinase ChiS
MAYQVSSSENLAIVRAEAESTEQVLLPSPGVSILVVADNPIALRSTVQILGKEGFAVKEVPAWKKAMDQVQSKDAALVILDLTQPTEGFVVCRGLRQAKSALELPILMLLPRRGGRSIAQAYEAGASDFLAKPYVAEELLARVRTLVNLKLSVDKAIASEIAFLQAQIKPHFIYNALSVIAAQTISNPEQARSLIINFSEYLRHSFNFTVGEDMIPLSQELELVQAYVALEKARFGRHLNFQASVPDECYGVKIPRLALQPLVENAIRHGICNLVTGGKVLLRAERSLDRLYFSVMDDGVGMDQEQVEDLLAGSRPGVGLVNIHKRLLRYYGQGLKIISNPGQGTTIAFFIPAPIRKEGDDCD